MKNPRGQGPAPAGAAPVAPSRPDDQPVRSLECKGDAMPSTTRTVNVGLIGLGTVGGGVARVIARHHDE